MNHLLNHSARKSFFILLFCAFTGIYFSCIKKTTTTTTTTTTPKVQPTTFTGSVNGSPTINFTPTKSASGGSTSLVGTSTYYTITLSFSSTTGPGSFIIKTAAGFSASIYDGSNTYVSNATYGSGSIIIDSIVSGKYYGKYNFIGQLPSTATESASGSFTNL
ncbi:MAG TPA: hypothetical protein VNY36_01795 [Bacteroidia bacterium]|nr:hypothetical protein [Bacteroidia bacterium]